jgi:hypothetical protein
MASSKKSLTRTPARLDCAYSMEAESPHVPWARPYARGEVRAFFLAGVNDGRAVVEMMQRLSLTGRAVSIDPKWDVNKWCMDRYPAMDRCAPRDYSVSFSVLEEELASSERYDVLVMHAVRGWFEFPARVKELILQRVRRGEGLVLVYPHLGEQQDDTSLWDLSPLVDVPPVTLRSPGAGIGDGYPHAPREAQSGGSWRRSADHYIVNGIPFDALPYPALRHYRCRLAEGAEALATGADGCPVIAVRRVGRGRVVGLGYHALGLFPELDARRGSLNENFWEYLFSILLRSTVWAARKEPALRVMGLELSRPAFPPEERGTGTIAVRLRNNGTACPALLTASFLDGERRVESRVRRTVSMKANGTAVVELPLPKELPGCGIHFVDATLTAGGLKHDWGSACYQVTAPTLLEDLALDADAVKEGGSLTGSLRVTGPVRGVSVVAQLWDQLDRQLSNRAVPARPGEDGRVAFRVDCPEALTPIGWVRCRLERDGRLLSEARAEVALTAPPHVWDDYEVILPWLHEGLWPWSRLVDSQYRRVGVTSTSDVQFPFRLTVSMHPPGFGIYWYKRQAYLERRAAYGRTRDTRLLARVPCIHTEEFRAPVAEALRKGIPPILKYSPLAYYMADESSITCYEDALDLCWHPETLIQFRLWLQRRFASLEALNAEWDTAHESWDAVMPMTGEQAQARGNPAPWMDHRLFMNHALADAFRYAVSVAREVDPDGLVTISGTQTPGSHNGCDWSQIDRIVEYLQPYSGGGQDEMHPSFNPRLILTGFTGYSLSGIPLEHEVWHRFFHGHRGASLFWGYTLVDPDLSLNAQGRSLSRVFGELQEEGLCRLLTGSPRVDDGICIHFSMASGHAWWISDGWLRYPEGELEYGMASSPAFRRFTESRVAWVQVLEDMGLQHRFLSYADLEAEGAAAHGVRVLVLPGSIALSDGEVSRVRGFVEAGGLLLTDVRPATMDEHGRRRACGALDDLFTAGASGKGRAVCLGSWLDGYPQNRLLPEGEGLRRRLGTELERAGIAPAVAVRGASGAHPVGVERVTWRGGGIEVHGLLKESRGEQRENPDGTSSFVLREGMHAEEPVTVAFPRAAHWYDLRAHRYLGERAEIGATLHEADPALYASLPYRVRGISLETGASPARLGSAARFHVRLDTGDAPAVRQVASVEVRRPDGSPAAVGPRSVELLHGRGEVRLFFALNDPAGEWTITVRDVFSGSRARRAFRVHPDNKNEPNSKGTHGASRPGDDRLTTGKDRNHGD